MESDTSLVLVQAIEVKYNFTVTRDSIVCGASVKTLKLLHFVGLIVPNRILKPTQVSLCRLPRPTVNGMLTLSLLDSMPPNRTAVSKHLGSKGYWQSGTQVEISS